MVAAALLQETDFGTKSEAAGKQNPTEKDQPHLHYSADKAHSENQVSLA